MNKYVTSRLHRGRCEQIIDVKYEDVRSDPLTIVRDVYHRRGQVLSQEAVRGISSWNEENPQYRFGHLPYSIERYGLSEHAVNEAFGAYLEHFAQYL
jgi:hypothetical protein